MHHTNQPDTPMRRYYAVTALSHPPAARATEARPAARATKARPAGQSRRDRMAAAAEFLLGKAESRRIEQAEAELNQREREWRWA